MCIEHLFYNFYSRYYYVVIMIELFVVVLPFMVCLSGICDAIGNGKVRLKYISLTALHSSYLSVSTFSHCLLFFTNILHF